MLGSDDPRSTVASLISGISPNPPAQAETESSGGSFVSSIGSPGGTFPGSFNTIGSIPPGYGDNNWSAMINGGHFDYFPNSGRAVDLNDVAAFNAYKGGGCLMIGSGVGVYCTY